MTQEKPLSPRERIYVDGRLAGMTQVAAAAAAGYQKVNCTANSIEKRPRVQKAMVARMNKVAEEVDFSRKEAHDMLMAAYINADTATEQIAAVNSMIKLHGIAEPAKVEHKHTHGGVVSLERMELEELIELAGMEGLTLEGEFRVLEDPVLLEDKDDNEREVPS